MHNSCRSHFQAALWVLRCLKGTAGHGLTFKKTGKGKVLPMILGWIGTEGGKVCGASAFWQGVRRVFPRVQDFFTVKLGDGSSFHYCHDNRSSRDILQIKSPTSTLCPIPTIPLFRTVGMSYGTQPSWGAYQRREPWSSCPCNKSCCICDLQPQQQMDGSGWIHLFKSKPHTESYLGPVRRKRLTFQRSVNVYGRSRSL